MNPILSNKLKANIQKEYNQEELLMAQNALKKILNKIKNLILLMKMEFKVIKLIMNLILNIKIIQNLII